MNRSYWSPQPAVAEREVVVPMSLVQGLRDERDALHTQLQETREALEEVESEPGLEALRADLRRIRARTADEVTQARRHERVERLRDLAEARDALERALAQSPDDGFAVGLRGVLGILDAGMRRADARLLGAVGDPFDPKRHEAIAVVSQAGILGEEILEIDRRGVELSDGTLVRPARVVVARPTPG